MTRAGVFVLLLVLLCPTWVLAAGVTNPGGGAGGGGGTVTSVDATQGVETTTGTAITTSGTVRGNLLVNNQTGTTYTILTGDRGKLVSLANAASIAVGLPVAGASFPSGWYVDLHNRGAGTVTITPVTSTIDGTSSPINLTTGQGLRIASDGTNYYTMRGISSASAVAFSGLAGGTNTSAAMLVGSGASLGPTGSGTVTATTLAANGSNCSPGSAPEGVSATGAVEGCTAYQPSDTELLQIATLADPNADRILFWDDSANAYAYLQTGTGLSITGTTLNATASQAFTDITAGTNTGQALVVGNGSTLSTSGTGTIAATTATGLATNGGNCSAGQAAGGITAAGVAEDCTDYVEEPAGTGVLAKTAANTTAARTLTGTATEIDVTNGNGVSGNPTVSLSAVMDLGGKTSLEIPNSTTLPATCTAAQIYFKTDATAGTRFKYCDSTNTWVTPLTDLVVVAPVDATYITQTPHSSLTNEQALSTLASGCLSVTTGTGVLASTGSACGAGGGGSIAGSTGSVDNALIRADGTGGGTIQAGGVVTLSDTGAFTFPDGVKQLFNPDGTNAGVNVGAQGGNPSSLADGDLWYNSSTPALNARINGATVSLGTGGTVTSVDASGGVETTTGSAITATGTVRSMHLVNAQTGTTYTLLTGDRGKLVTLSNASSVGVSLPQAGGTFPAGWYVMLQNLGAGTVTVTPTTSTIDGAGFLTLETNQGVYISSDGSNYVTMRGRGVVAEADTLNTVVARGATASGLVSLATSIKFLEADNYVNGVSGIGFAFYIHSTDGPTFVCIVGGVENACDYYRKLAAGKKIGVKNSSGTIIWEVDEATGTVTNGSINAETTGVTITIPIKYNFKLVGCAGTTGTLLLDTNATLAPTATCAAGSTNTTLMIGTADFPDSDGEYQVQDVFRLPGDFTGTIDLQFYWRAAATSGDVVWQAQTMCTSDAEVEDVAWNTASTVTDTAKGTTLQYNSASITGVTATNCAAGDLLHLKFMRQRTHASDSITGVVSLRNVEMTVRRGM